ncbi:glutathione S-transferase protein-like protein [Hypoxylon cercidicola]|nr:glutathione S-transferase protein-like protein [Hypoxylon cercidicola]
MTSPPYEIVYYHGVPGRGEHIRLILEEAGATYNDLGALGWEKCGEYVNGYLKGHGGNPPYFAMPMLKHGDLIINQTPNILLYLGSRLKLCGSAPDDLYRVNALALTALDGLSTEVHDCHHPIAIALYWEDQKEESMRRSKEWVKSRLPQHLDYWERALKSASEGSHGPSPGPWLMGDTFTYADLVLFQCLDGTTFAFPKALGQAKESGKYKLLFEHYDAVKARPKIASYLASDKRQKYDWGVYRYYPGNDVVAE